MKALHACSAAVAFAMVASGCATPVPVASRPSAILTSPADSDRAITHVLNRAAFGPRPGDVDRVRKIGLGAYIDRQLHPEQLSDAALNARLDGLSSIRMSSREI